MTFLEFVSILCTAFAMSLFYSFFRKKEGNITSTTFFIKVILYGLLVVFTIGLGTKTLFVEGNQQHIARILIWAAFGAFMYWRTQAISAPHKAD